MKQSLSIWTLILPLTLALYGPVPPSRVAGHFTLRVLAAHLGDPWSELREERYRGCILEAEWNAQ